jgi:glucan phosphorylase
MEIRQSGQLEMLNGVVAIVTLPSLINELKTMISNRNDEISSLKDIVLSLSSNLKGEDRYMSAEDAQKYLGMSKGTFEKYRYSTKVKFKSYPLDGKHWFKKSDLDRFMSLYSLKTAGLA